MNVTKEVYDIRIENKRLKEIDRKHRKLLKDHVEINELLMAENKALSNDFRFQVKENCRIANKLNEVEDSMDDLLKLLKRIADPKDYGWNAEIIEKSIRKAEALKEETK